VEGAGDLISGDAELFGLVPYEYGWGETTFFAGDATFQYPGLTLGDW